MDLRVQIGQAEFQNPVTVASGTFGHAEKYFQQEEVKRLGAITPKTVTLHAQEGNSPVRIVETPSGMLNAIGIENPGIDAFLQTKLPHFQKTNVPLIISILGHTDDQFETIAQKVSAAEGIAAVELNLSCPNLNHKTLAAQDPVATARIIKKVKNIVQVPVLAKLAPNVTDITVIAQAAEDAGADGLSLINTFTGMVIDTHQQRSALGNYTGGLSGPAIRPLAVHMVHQCALKVKIPIVAMGGIACADDAIEFILAGATMVAVGTMNFIDPKVPVSVLEGIEAYMKKHNAKILADIRGKVRR